MNLLPSRERSASLVLAGLLAGCAVPKPALTPPAPPQVVARPPLPTSADLLTRANEEAADQLAGALRAACFDPNAVLLVAGFVPLGDVRRSFPLGRLAAEQVAARLTQQGLTVKELRLRDALASGPVPGELVISPQARDTAHQHRAQAVVTGVYSGAPDATRMSLRVVRLDNSVVVAATNYSVQVDEQTIPLQAPAPVFVHRSLYDAVRDYLREQPPLR